MTPTRPAARHRARLRTAKAFSLLELIVIATVGSVLFLLLMRWILGLGAVANDSISSALAATDASYAASLMASDFAAARPCVNGTGQAVVELNPTTLTFFAVTQRPDGTDDVTVLPSRNAMSLVTWRVDASGAMVRKVEPVDPVTCASESGAGADVVVASPVYFGTGGSPTTKFVPLVAGQSVQGECTRVSEPGAADYGSGQACAAQAVRVFFTFLTPGADPNDPAQWGADVSPVLVERSYALGNQKGL